MNRLPVLLLAVISFSFFSFSAEENKKPSREQILEMFRTEMYGHEPQNTDDIWYEQIGNCDTLFGGKAIKRTIRMHWNRSKEGPYADMALFLPANSRKSPVFVGLSFDGNGSLTGEAWPIEMIISRGYGLATAGREDISGDDVNAPHPIQDLYPETQKNGDNWATISCWAWAMSRIADYLATDSRVDSGKLICFGHSRLGKAAVWAGAQDERFRIVASIQSGAGGAKMFHCGAGEMVGDLCRNFPHWYCRNFSKYIGKDTEMPFDQDMMMDCVWPRALYISSAIEDQWSYPSGEFMGAKAVADRFRERGEKIDFPDAMPPVNTPYGVGTRLGYHLRDGQHAVKPYDWNRLMDFADAFWKIDSNPSK